MDSNTIKLFGSKKTDHWQTPRHIYLFYMMRGYFDPCPINPQFDGLNINWKEKNFVNPPYSKVGVWLEKATQELNNNPIVKEIVFLVFANTDTKWFHKYIYGKAEIKFIKGRLKFLDVNRLKKGVAMRPSMIVIFKKDEQKNY